MYITKVALMLLLALALVPGGTSAQATQDRMALVIGNGAYGTAPLKNPVNDAADMAAKLRILGFDVIYYKDLDRTGMRKAIREFRLKLRKTKEAVGLFYYAGHGMQVNGENYLIPVDADITAEFEVQDEAIQAEAALRAMESANAKLSIVILDACRNNPFARSFRSSSRGLARMRAPTGTLIAYATAPDSVAADGSERNGVYTKHLLRYIDQPGLTINQVFQRVRDDVLQETGRKQTPWESSSMVGGDFYFLLGDLNIGQVAQVPPRPAAAVSTPAAYELEFWKSASAGNTCIDYDAYLEAYPTGQFGLLAQGRRRQLGCGRPRKAKLTIRSNVANDAAYIDGNAVGPTGPTAHEVTPGEHQVRVEKDGWLAFTETIVLAAGDEKVVQARLAPERSAKYSAPARAGKPAHGPAASARSMERETTTTTAIGQATNYRPARVARVAADRNEWQNVGIRLEKGSTYLITAKGEWRVGGLCRSTGPDGFDPYTLGCWDLGNQTVEGASHSALIARIGERGTPFSIGASYELTANESAALYFMANDGPDWFFDNTGEMEVTVRLLQKAASARP